MILILIYPRKKKSIKKNLKNNNNNRGKGTLQVLSKIILKAKKLGFNVSNYDRSKEPKKSKQSENSSISWGISNALRTKSPDIIYHRGDIGKEPMILIFGNDPRDVIKKTSMLTVY